MSQPSEEVRVLHVDDDPEFGDLVATFLEREDDRLSVVSATDAGEGRELLGEEDVDCVVSDYDMPGQNGIDFLESVREGYPDLPFVLFTGKGSESVASEAISAGVTDYLQKETGTDQYTVLANRITNAVEQYRTERKLDTTRERMRFALESTNSIVFEVDMETQVDTHHGPFEELYGVPKDRISTTRDFNEYCVHPDDRERIDKYQRPEMFSELGETVEFEFRTNPNSGDVRWIRSQAYIDTDEDGTPSRLVGIDTDITELKHRQQELKNTSTAMQQDLRNQLTAVEENLDLAGQECDSDHLKTALEATQRSLSILDDAIE